MKIKTKLLIMGILPAMIFLITGSLFILLNHQKSKALQRIQVIDHLVNSGLKFVLISEHTLHQNQRTDSQWIESYKAMKDGIADASPYFLSGNESPVIDDMVRSMKKVKQMIETIESPDGGISGVDADAGSRRKGHRADLHSMIMIELQSMISHSTVLKQRANDDLVQGWKTQSLVFISLFLLLAGAMLGLLLRLTSGINIAIDRLIEGTSAVFSGNLDFRVDLAGEDEFSLLSKAFDQMTQKLHETGSKLRQFAAIIEATSDFVGITDAGGCPKYINPAGRRLLEIGENEDISQTRIPDYLTQRSRPDIMTRIIPLSINDGTVGFESEFLSRSGKIIPFSGVALSQRGPDGKVNFLALISRDITGQVKMETDLKNEKKLADTIIDIMPGIFYIFDGNGSFLRWNKNTELVTGYTSQDLSGMSPLDFFSGRDRFSVEQKILEAFERGQASTDAELVAKDGTRTPYILTGRQVTLNQSKYIMGLGIDITQRRQTEQALERFTAIIENTSDFVGIADAMGNIQYINPAGRKMLGIGLDEDLKNKTLAECYTKETGRYIVDEIIPLTILNGTAEFESEFLSRSGQLIPYSGVFLARKTPEGAPEFLSLIARDISERRKHEKKIDRLVEALERSNRELEQIAYVASHDLQEPLRKVVSFIELFAGKYQGKIDEKADSYIAYIVDGGTRMSRLINDLLIYSRAVANKAEFKLVDCNTVMETVLSDMEFTIAEKKAAVTFDPLPRVSGDETQMRQLFQNLISNAVKYQKMGEPPVLHVSAVRTGSEWQLSFKDNGVGIEPEYFDKIFVLFQRLHTRMDYPGTGIGLAVCKKIVENHGGRIWVESEFEKGSTFYFSLPVP